MGTLDQKLQYLNETKNQIKQAIINKGQNIQDNDSFRSYVEKINNISLDTNALETDLLLSKTAYVKGQKITGTMPNNNDVIITPTTEIQNKNKGYYNSLTIEAVTSKIDSNIVANNIKKGISILGIVGTLEPKINTSDATAIADNILLDKTAYVNDKKITGTMPNNGDVTITPTTNVQNKTAGFYNSINIKAVTASIDTNIKAENIKSGISILGVAGTLQTGIDTSDATATAGDIVSGKTAYVKGQKITGGLQDSFPNEQINVVNAESGMTPYPSYTHRIGSKYIEIRINSDKIYRKGLTLDLNSTGQLAEVIGLTADKIKAGVTILGITGTYNGPTV